MKLFWSESKNGNVGDDLNPYMWPRLFQDGFFNEDPREVFVGVGSILSKQWTFAKGARKIVFGSGGRSNWSLPDIDDSWDIRFVRGPQTVSALQRVNANVKCITDPAVMMPLIFQPEKTGSASAGPRVIGFVPYFRTPRNVVKYILQHLDAVEISPHLQPEDFVNQISRCDCIIAEAMHGAILADAYRIPWMGVRVFNELFEGFTSRFKWADSLQSLGMDSSCVIQAAPPMLRFARKGTDKFVFRVIQSDWFRSAYLGRAVRTIRSAMQEDRWVLSDEATLQQRQEAINTEISLLQSAYS